MVQRHGEDMRESLQFLERLRATKAAKLHEAEQSLFHLASSYDKGMDEQPTITPLPHLKQCPPSSVLLLCLCQNSHQKHKDTPSNPLSKNTLVLGPFPRRFTECHLYSCLHQERRSSTKCSQGPSNM
jgi:hypothetical protein